MEDRGFARPAILQFQQVRVEPTLSTPLVCFLSMAERVHDDLRSKDVIA
jgi:hypothetical protein